MGNSRKKYRSDQYFIIYDRAGTGENGSSARVRTMKAQIRLRLRAV